MGVIACPRPMQLSQGREMRRATIERLLAALDSAELHSLDPSLFLQELERAFRSHIEALPIHDPAHGRSQLGVTHGMSAELIACHGDLAPGERGPHLHHMPALHQRLCWSESLTQGLRLAMDRLGEGVLLLDGRGRVVFANEAGQRATDQATFLRISDGEPHATWMPDERQLRHVVTQACAADAEEPIVFRLHDTRGKLACVIKLCPLSREAGAPWSESDVHAMAFLRDASAPSRPDPVALAATWGFTPAEAELAHELLGGSSLDDVAAAGHVSKNTVRTQIRALFAKTDTSRQADLVRVMLQLTPY